MKVRIVAGVDGIVKTIHGSPARAAYAAVEAPWFPVEAATTPGTLYAAATLIATLMSRSLNDHVGFCDSSLSHRPGNPRSDPNRRSGTSGVPPSPSVI